MPRRRANEGRVGIGWDAHPLAPGIPCRIGGVAIPCDEGPRGHSDGDPLLHALADALYGAIADGDLGTHFPDADAANAGRDSAEFVSAALGSVAARGLGVANVDAVVTAEKPRLGPHRDAIRGRIAGILGVPLDSVSVKAKSWQGLPAGAGSVLAQVVVLLAPRAGKNVRAAAVRTRGRVRDLTRLRQRRR
ncbi:MAG: 2-C-methyl-D-erythritol 2,4-cyclodiphosphate synthase [Planctomycetales bacterium]|nr:2-C-methyl-D-erythritol 2,4-cyclodiphosphate synthase [Planctomycetales bacterium]